MVEFTHRRELILWRSISYVVRKNLRHTSSVFVGKGSVESRLAIRLTRSGGPVMMRGRVAARGVLGSGVGK